MVLYRDYNNGKVVILRLSPTNQPTLVYYVGGLNNCPSRITAKSEVVLLNFYGRM
jgi:hypothetical protein